jgi:hypothetical protein
MKLRLKLAVAVLAVGVASLASCTPKPVLTGGSAATSTAKREITEAAAFAVEAQNRVLQGGGNPSGSPLVLVRIIRAEEQVVAGMNYRLWLEVKQDGKVRKAEALVWWQSWRKPDPYQLSGWKWE